MKQVLFLVACALLAVLPLAFVFSKAYNDRVVGRLALLGVSFAAWTYLIDFAMGARYNALPQTVMLFWCVALYLGWHYLRFYWRMIRMQKDGKSANDVQQTVQFFTYADICKHRGSKEIMVHLCRNPAHEASNTGLAVCAEQVCPDMKRKAE